MVKILNYLVFQKDIQVTVIVPIQDGEQRYPNKGIKIRTEDTGDGFGSLTDEELAKAIAAEEAIQEIWDLFSPDTENLVLNATYHHEVTDEDGEYVKGNNVTVELIDAVKIGDDEVKTTSTGNLRDYAKKGSQQASIKARIDNWGMVCVQKLNM